MSTDFPTKSRWVSLGFSTFRSVLRAAAIAALLLAASPARAQTPDEFPIRPNPSNPSTDACNPFGIAGGPASDGNVWFTETYAPTPPLRVGKITPAGVVTEYQLPAGTGALSMTLGPNGQDLWFTGGGKITTTGVVTSYPALAGGQYIAAGPDGMLWVTETPNRIIRVDPSNGAQIGSYTVPSAATTLGAVTAGPDGNIWFTESDYQHTARVARIDLSRLTGCDTDPQHPCIKEKDIPGETGAFGLTGITGGPPNDPHVWCTSTGHVNRIDLGDDTGIGTITPIAVASATTQGGITVGPDGNLWYAGANGKIGRVTTAGAVTEIDAKPDFTSPRQITAGPDGNIWFTEINAQKIGVIYLSGGPPPPAPIRGNVIPVALPPPVVIQPGP